MSDPFCNVSVTDSVGLQNNRTTYPGSNTKDLNSVRHDNCNDNCIQSPLLKKARLSEMAVTLPIPNGFKGAYSTCNLGSLLEIQEEIKKVRLGFDSQFRQALKGRLTKYLNLIEAAEKGVNSLKDEANQLTSRMDFILSSSKDMVKMINDRIPLPTPTSAASQQRTPSSQAPRPPLIVPAVSKSSRLVSTTNALNRQPNISSNTSQANNQLAGYTAPKMTAIAPKVSDVGLRPVPGTVLAIQVNDTIDLTSDTTIENALGGRLISGSANMSNIIVTPRTTPNVNKLNHIPLSNVQKIPLNTVNTPLVFGVDQSNSNQSYISITPLSQNTQIAASNNIVNSLPICVISDVQLLPISVLPAVVPQAVTKALQLPIQPVPQLTIGNSTEGVTLQWTITYPAIPFEPAVAYEIYSHTTSDTALVSFQMPLPWNKIGEVAALPLPMACTLNHVQPKYMYYFIVRSVDRLHRYSPWSNVVNAYVA
ncbi:unnamed protein product [Trichobilharzia szidati]|nr:unnamed protein product [Trichobilharzia szidati]